jgi:hypothetical protein
MSLPGYFGRVRGLSRIALLYLLFQKSPGIFSFRLSRAFLFTPQSVNGAGVTILENSRQRRSYA